MSMPPGRGMLIVVMVVAVVMMIVSMPAITIMIVIMMLVALRRRYRCANRVQWPAEAARGMPKSAALDPDQPRADQRDQGVAHQLDDALGIAHLPGGGVEQGRGDADDRDGNQRLKQRRGKRQHDAAPPGFLVCDQIGRDHRLAVA